jgi:hypothetical protein
VLCAEVSQNPSYRGRAKGLQAESGKAVLYVR